MRHGTSIAALVDRHRGRIAVLLIMAGCVYFTIAFGNQAWRANQLQAQVDAQRAAIARTQDDRADLETQQAALSGDGYNRYAQRIARRDLNLANPGETLILVHWEHGASPLVSAPGDAVPASRDSANWRNWLHAFFGDE